jgi:hypothetical protein
MVRVSASWCALLLIGVVTFFTTSFCYSVPSAYAQGQPDPKKLEEAKQHMAAGSAFYNDPAGHKCEEALREFSKAYELSGSWKALRAMAICELELERDGDAIKHYDEVLRLGGTQIEAADKAQIERDLTALKSAVAELTIRTNRPNTRVVAVRQPSQGLPVTNRYVVTLEGSTLGIHPGQYNFTATAEGFPDITWQTEIQNGGKYNKLLEFKPGPVTAPGPGPGPALGPDKAPEMERPVPVYVWIMTGVTIASAGVWGTFMGLSAAAKSEYDDKNGNAPRAELEDLRSDVTTKNVVADVMLGVTAASLGTTLILYFTRPEVSVGQDTAITVVPAVGPGAGGVTLSGTF